MLNNSNMQDGRAFFSGQTFKIKGKDFTTRVYYADSEKFKKALVSYIPKPTSYKESPFYSLEIGGHEKDQSKGFAYYTYGDDDSIKEFTYVNETNVYRTTDGGKTWYDITP